jgi:hypothetical protein
MHSCLLGQQLSARSARALTAAIWAVGFRLPNILTAAANLWLNSTALNGTPSVDSANACAKRPIRRWYSPIAAAATAKTALTPAAIPATIQNWSRQSSLAKASLPAMPSIPNLTPESISRPKPKTRTGPSQTSRERFEGRSVCGSTLPGSHLGPGPAIRYCLLGGGRRDSYAAAHIPGG